MAKNIEIKAHVEDIKALLNEVEQVADHGPHVIHQDDTFFNCENGRLKLRVYSEIEGELIFYQRPDQGGPKQSFYVISKTTSPASLCESLTLAYGVSGNVKKKRILFFIGRTRVHIDQVENLGNFMELEVVLSEGESAEDGITEAKELMAKLAIDSSDLIERAYVDMLTHLDKEQAV